ncbi:hypothetical protein C8F01DRAFT_1101821 [Mycena amicta]|nr:hypothetical protein C8F01DRAFT_1101821 [Mycena amicta]
MATNSTSTPLLTDFELDERELDDEYTPAQDDGSEAQRRKARMRWSSTARSTAGYDRRTLLLLIFASFVSILSIGINLLNLSPSPPTSTTKKSPSSNAKLTYPNPYIGLEHAVLPTSVAPAKPIFNSPLLLAQVNSSAPERVHLQTPHWDSSFGMIYGEDREVEVTGDVSTIAQFRTLDYGMERCVLTLEMPSSANADADNLPHKTVTISSSSSASPLSLQIYSSSASESITPQTLSWNTRPKRTKLLATFSLDAADARVNGAVLSSEPFNCPQRTLLTFEMAFAPDCKGCRLRFLQDRKPPRLGLYVTQHPGSA